MTDQNVATPELSTQPTEEVTSTDSVNPGKTFSQKELEAAVHSRVERERTGHKAKETTWTSEKVRLETDLATSNTLLEKYQGLISQTISKQLAALPEAIKALVQKMDPLEQIEWLETNGQSFSKQGVPPVPDGSKLVATPEEILAKKRASGIY